MKIIRDTTDPLTQTSGFYTFNQNNSGGRFHYDESAGLTHYVVIEAYSEADAVNRATGLGIYFNGISTGDDCSCCGDRWSSWIERSDTPMLYGEIPVSDDCVDYPFIDGGHEVFVHYLDGRIEGYQYTDNESRDE